MEANPGDVIIVRVGGVDYETVIDENGVQRFPEDPNNSVLLALPMVGVSMPGGTSVNMRDMNELALRYHRGAITQREYAEATMAVGYSVSGFSDYSSFSDMLLENPLWQDEDDNEWRNHTDSYLLRNLKKGELTLRRVIEIIQLRDGVSAEEAEQHFVDEFVTEW